MTDTLRADVRARVDEAKKILRDTPRITVAKFQEQVKCAEKTAMKTLRIARNELQEENRELQEKEGTSALALQEKQHKHALRVLNSQLTRLEHLPNILVALRNKVFSQDDSGRITGIKRQLQGKTKDGTKIYHTYQATVREYLAVEKQILEQERLVSGITAMERVATAKAGKTELTLELPFTREELAQVKPTDRPDTIDID